MKTSLFGFSIVAVLLLVGCATSYKATETKSMTMSFDIQQLDSSKKQEYEKIVPYLDNQFNEKKEQCVAAIEKMDNRIKHSSEWFMGLTIAGGVAGGTGTVLLAISSANIAGAAIASGVAGVIALGQAFFQDGGLKDPVGYAKMRDELDGKIKGQIKKWGESSKETDVEKRINTDIANKRAIIYTLDSLCFSVPLQMLSNPSSEREKGPNLNEKQ